MSSTGGSLLHQNADEDEPHQKPRTTRGGRGRKGKSATGHDDEDWDYDPSNGKQPSKKRKRITPSAKKAKTKQGQSEMAVVKKIGGLIPNVTDVQGKQLPLSQKKSNLFHHVMEKVKPMKMPMRHHDVRRGQHVRGK